MYFSLSPLPYTSLLSSIIYKASEENHFALLHLIFSPALAGGFFTTSNAWEAHRTGWLELISSVQLLSCVQLCDPMDGRKPGFPVHHQLLEPAQTHVHRVCDGIQPSHPLPSPSPPALNISQHRGLFQ